MGIEENKVIASELFRRISANDFAGALDTMADDATYWVAGKPGTAPMRGTLTKERFGRQLKAVGNDTKHGLRMTVKSIIAEGDKVALEIESHAELKNGRMYDQQYHTLVEIRNGKISAVREYMDTQHVLDIWFRP